VKLFNPISCSSTRKHRKGATNNEHKI
jgi:hypothetical protein